MVDATPDDAVFTKEDYEMYIGLVGGLQRDIEFNIIDWIKTQTDDPAKIEEFINFMNIRKTGAFRLEHKRLQLDYIQKDIDLIMQKKDDIIQYIVNLGSFNYGTTGGVAPTLPFDVAIIAAQIVYKAIISAFLILIMTELEVLFLEKQALKMEILQRPLIEFK